MTRLRVRLVAGVVLVATACAPGTRATPATPGPPPTTAVPAVPPRPTPSPPAPSPVAYGPVATEATDAGAWRGSIEGPDGTRTFSLHLPDRLVPDAPLLVALHGFTQGSAGFETYTGLAAAATARGIATVVPDGIEDSWNGGSSCCPPASRRGIDDVGFLRALTRGLHAELDLDPERTWLVGFSNGGFLALRTACEAPGAFSAVVSHAGTMDLACEPQEPVSVLLSHGDRDALIPFEGGRGPVSPQAAGRGARDVFAAWRTLGGCPEPTPRDSLAGEELLAAPCDGGTAVGLAVWAGVGHVWPANLNQLLLDWLDEDAARRR
ncbi:MAG: prolyl oligopeptidase family serine peptidase [Actinobacteria bacterium]|nr:prolyl oligopeptidase family serine peptidase [Actinomycetota bacterium]